MGEFVSSKIILIFGVGVLAFCLFVSISLADTFTAVEQHANQVNSPLFPRS